MDGEAGWWTTCGNIGLPPLARVMGVGRQQQLSECSNTAVAMNFLNTLKQKTSTDGESMKQIESSDERHVFNLQKFDTTSVSSELKKLTYIIIQKS